MHISTWGQTSPHPRAFSAPNYQKLIASLLRYHGFFSLTPYFFFHRFLTPSFVFGCVFTIFRPLLIRPNSPLILLRVSCRVIPSPPVQLISSFFFFTGMLHVTGSVFFHRNFQAPRAPYLVGDFSFISPFSSPAHGFANLLLGLRGLTVLALVFPAFNIGTDFHGVSF